MFLYILKSIPMDVLVFNRLTFTYFFNSYDSIRDSLNIIFTIERDVISQYTYIFCSGEKNFCITTLDNFFYYHLLLFYQFKTFYQSKIIHSITLLLQFVTSA